MAHSHPATRRGLEEMAIFTEEGVDPKLVQIAHTGDTDDLDYIEELLARAATSAWTATASTSSCRPSSETPPSSNSEARLCASG